MLNYFKTSANFAHPLSYYEAKALHHPVHVLDAPINPICPLGNALSWVLGAYLIGRGVMMDAWGISSNILHAAVLAISGALSLLNFNATLYLSPVLVLEGIRMVA